MPKHLVTLMREAARHILRRPVVGVAIVPRLADGRVLLIRRGDSGEWALPGGTVEWGETIVSTITREMREEAGVSELTVGRLVGVFSRPDRDVRFHGITIGVECSIGEPTMPASNPLEILEVRTFSREDVPKRLAMGMEDILLAADRGETIVE